MPPLAYFGIESSGLNLVIDLLILFVVVLYVSLIYWTYADARRRIEDPMLVGCSVAASLFPFVGTIVYMVLRPPEYLEDVHEREIETAAAEARLRELEYGQCPHCDYPIERDFIRCPSCLRKLKDRCANCARPLEQAWTICPYCEAEVMTMPAARRATTRRRARPQLETERASLRDTSARGSDLAADTELSDIGGSASRRAARGGARADEDAPPAPAPVRGRQTGAPSPRASRPPRERPSSS